MKIASEVWGELQSEDDFLNFHFINSSRGNDDLLEDCVSPKTRIMTKVKIIEVGPRDGLQNISEIVSTEIKIELIRKLAQTGLRVIEATSFSSAKWIPQLADGSRVLQGIQSFVNSQPTIQYPVLVPNVLGLEKAVECGVREVAVFVSATEGFSKRNINCSVAESLVKVRQVTKRAQELGIQVRGYVSHEHG